MFTVKQINWAAMVTRQWLWGCSFPPMARHDCEVPYIHIREIVAQHVSVGLNTILSVER